MAYEEPKKLEDSQKLFEIKYEGEERKFKIFIVIEMLRLLFWTWFLCLIVVEVALTVTFAEEGYEEILVSLVGSVNTCVYFDFPPSTYLSPSFYAFWPVMIFLYCSASILRAWISNEEKKISMTSLIPYSFAFIYFFCSSLIFTTSLAVQIDLNKLPQTWMIHLMPFTNMVVSMAILQIAVTWFNNKVAWKNLHCRLLHISNYMVAVTMTTSSIVKVFQHINAFGGLQMGEGGEVVDNGWIVSVNNKTFGMFGQINDAIWMLSAIVVPVCQSGYLTWRKFDTHGLILTIEDNRAAKDVYTPLLSASDE